MLIYDVGMHNGDDAAYYLAKGAQVVAIEANPSLCAMAYERFDKEIGNKSLIVINCAVSDRRGEVDFFLNETSSVQSSLRPKTGRDTRSIKVDARPLSCIIQEFGKADFIKIDVEHYDHVVLSDLRANRLLPPQLSVEAHDFTVIRELLKTDYSKFRLVRGNTVGRRFANQRIETPKGAQVYSFNPHSSGPFGKDLPGSWMSAQAMTTSWLMRSSL
jgi:FkbM family methyltransferase